MPAPPLVCSRATFPERRGYLRHPRRIHVTPPHRLAIHEIHQHTPPLLAAAFALLFAGALHAQPGQAIHGRVVDRATGEPIATATVRVTATGGAVEKAQSDQAGRFSIRLPAEGTYTVTAERLGYRDFTSAPVAVAPDAILEVQVRMVPEALALDSVAVRVRQVPDFRNPVGRAFFDRMQRRDGHFFTPEMLAARQPVLVSTLLQSLPGVRPVNGGRQLV